MTKTRTAVVYARFSSDMQRDTSIDDQVTLCRQIAMRHGLEITKIYTDRAKSAASMFDRDGLLELMTQAKEGLFGFVICESLDRLSRDQEDTAGIHKRLTFNGVKIITNEGPVEKIHVGVRGIVGAMFLDDLAQKVRRHHDARAREGIIPGCMPYGYRQKPGGRKGEPEIHPEQAEIVRRFFTEYAEGKSPRDIALDLTRDGIATPGGKSPDWHSHVFTHGRGSGGMIANQLYIGQLIWSAYRTVKNPDTGKPVRRKNAPENVVTTPVPHLRIISDELFNRANELRRQRAVNVFGPKGSRPPIASKTKDDCFISGILFCGECGGRMVVTKTRQTKSTHRQAIGPRVGCAEANYRGKCDHRKSYDLKRIELTVLDGMRRHLTSPAALMEFTKAYHERWAQRQREATDELETSRRKLNAVTVKIDRLVTAITDSDEPMPVLMQKMKELEAERVGLAERVRLVEAEGNVVSLHPAAIQRFATDIYELHRTITEAGSFEDLDGTERGRFRLAIQNIFEKVVVHKTTPRQHYYVTPYARLSAIMGVDLFPTMRTENEMLAEQGGLKVANGELSLLQTDKPSAHMVRQFGASRPLICLGGWAEAA